MAGDLCAPPLAFVKIFFDLRCETRSPGEGGGILFSWPPDRGRNAPKHPPESHATQTLVWRHLGQKRPISNIFQKWQQARTTMLARRHFWKIAV